jgi:ubiquinone/menaquinone biosynthesis C-methylase UbiE
VRSYLTWEADVTIGSESEPLAHIAPKGSQGWDYQNVAQDHQLLSSHLDAVAETAPIQLAAQHAIELMRLRPGEKALDAGCGTGSFFAPLAAALGPNGEIVGVDHAPEFFESARQQYAAAKASTGLTLVDADINDLPFDAGTFDAAHCERVLIHLADPQQALRELHRVVRPGGWVVAVEPDLAGWRVDHEDRENVAKIAAGFMASIRNPSMGLELNRRMAEVGLVNRQYRFVTEVETTIEPDIVVYYEQAAESAARQGLLSMTQARTTLDALKEQAELGQFTSYSSLFIWAGQVPG